MPRNKISEYSTTNSDNTDISSINIAEGCAPSGINNAIREVMVHLKNWQTNASGDGATFASLVVQGTGSFTGAVTMSAGATLSGTNTLSGSNIMSGNINSSGSTNTFSGTVVMSGANTISHAAGTVSAPSITVNGDSNTGIFFPAADTIAFAEGGAEAMRIDSSGMVGVGVTPTAWASTFKAIQLGAYGVGWNTHGSLPIGYLNANCYYNGTNWIYTTSNPVAQFVTQGQSGSFQWNTAASGTAGNAITFTQAMTLDASGNLGIGLSNPDRKLHVSSNVHPQIRLVYPSVQSYDIGVTSGGLLSLGVAGTGAVNIDSSGNVGIGITPNAWSTANGGRAIQLPGAGFWSYDTQNAYFSQNLYWDGSVRKYVVTAAATEYQQGAGIHQWFTAASGTAGNTVTLTERARITSGGDLLIGDTTASAKLWVYRTDAGNTFGARATSATYASTVGFFGADRNTTNNTFYYIECYNYGAAAYKFRVADSGNVTNTNGSYGTISDAKLKQDIVDAGSQWNDIKNLRFRKYRLKSEVELDPNAKPFLGLVAQEAELVSPGLIEEHPDTTIETKTREVEKTREIPAVLDEDGNEVEPARTETYTETEEYTETVDLGTTTKSIKTSILYMKAVKALQEAMTRIEALEAEVAAMKAQ